MPGGDNQQSWDWHEGKGDDAICGLSHSCSSPAPISAETQ